MRTIVALLSALLLAACTQSVVDKAGGPGPVITLKLATSDYRGGPQDSQIKHFAEAVADRSAGRLHVRTTYVATGDREADFDQQVARRVQDGTFDLGVVPARSWDDLGVEGLRALQTPFLLDSDDLVDRVVDGDLAEPLLASLEGTGVRGLALWPETLRHPVGFGTPLLTLADFRGARIQAPYSRDVYAMLRAPGSHPVWLDGQDVNDAYEEGSLAGAESGADRSFGPPATLTADVTLYGKIDTLVVNDSTWNRLPDDARTALTEAARSTRDSLVQTRPREGELLYAACAEGKGVAMAGPAAVAEIKRSTAPLRAQMLADPQVGPTIRRIEALKADGSVAPVVITQCRSSGAATDIGTPIDPAVLDGTYRTTFTEKELLDIGVAEQDVKQITGAPWTITLDGGHYSDLESDCTATYRVSRAMISFNWDPGVRCSGNWSAHWDVNDGGLRFLRVQSAYAGDRAVWGLHEWVRLR
ncbi:TRAP transporter substrate-binding protein [Nocardioides guangzhouensis]|uniref:TRAP transporter substrate-binding protein n=1 Tax=Nocardioides guangzhouensis TaxID=2497878 RepID=UPI00143854F0|nr:TRAP transporter substrate-binding protein DctP [Nocardioides guangzhouensis]